MKLKWIGHAAFLMTAADGTRVLADPYNAEVGYKVPLDEADYVTVSHEHFDHNSVQNVPGAPHVARGTGQHTLGTVAAVGVATMHDDAGGSKRGANTVFCYDFPEEGGPLSVCHLGDLGHQLTPEQLAGIGDVDVLLVPVGGRFTVDAKGARELIAAVKPRVAVPMHYKTAALSFPLSPVDDFLSEMAGAPVEKPGVSTVELPAAQVKALARSDKPKVIVLRYAG